MVHVYATLYGRCRTFEERERVICRASKRLTRTDFARFIAYAIG